jgi:hypothetical protein
MDAKVPRVILVGCVAVILNVSDRFRLEMLSNDRYASPARARACGADRE